MYRLKNVNQQNGRLYPEKNHLERDMSPFQRGMGDQLQYISFMGSHSDKAQNFMY